MAEIEYLTAQTEAGREAIRQVMDLSFQADLEPVPPEWAICRLVDGVPVSFIVIDPSRVMHYFGCGLSYAFIRDVATREDRRDEGHFRAIMEEGFHRVRTAGLPLTITHGRYQLYRRFGFDVFTHNAGIFIQPEMIERCLGSTVPGRPEDWVKVSNTQFVLSDLLLVYRTRSQTMQDARNALLSAAALARSRHKARILFEEPEAPSYGSTYPLYPSPETPLARLAQACGGRLVVQGANPEAGPVPDADWLKVLDTPVLIERALDCMDASQIKAEIAIIWIETEAGNCLVESTGQGVYMRTVKPVGAEVLPIPSTTLGQLVTGYKSIDVLMAEYQLHLSDPVLALFRRLFPPTWRFSRNESWTYKA